MSKLRNAPLLEVIYELRWNVTNKSDLTKYQYLHGDIYSLLKTEYPHRELLAPPEVPVELFVDKPIHRFRKSQDQYPLIQIGPGIITLNTIDEQYYWEEYFSRCNQLNEAFFNVYPAVESEKFRPSLLYFDFLEINPDQTNIQDFINANLNIKLHQEFYKATQPPKSINIGLSFFNEVGQLNFSIIVGKNSKQQEGLIMQIGLNGPNFARGEEVKTWLEKAHELSTTVFREVTKGRLYESFK